MGNGISRRSIADCCVRRPDGSSCCDINNSVLGEDAFYRDAFYDCEEGNGSHDVLFAALREQARLKLRKGSVLADFASFEFKRTANKEAEAVSSALKECIALPHEDARQGAGKRTRPTSPRRGGSWLGRTIPEWTGKEFPVTGPTGAQGPHGEGAYWQKGEGKDLKVRSKDYKQHGKKVDTTGSMYEALSCDAIKADKKIENIITAFLKGRIPPPPQCGSNGDRGGGGALQWTRDCPLPRVICINLMLPYTTGMIPLKSDPGCSFVGFFHIRPETIKAIQSKDPPEALRLFKEFWDGPAGHPESPATDPDRSLFARVNERVKKDQQRGLFKAVAHCVNPQEVHVPKMFHTYNGKPCLITKSGYIVKDPNLEWLEVGIDVRGFNILARKMLCSFRQLLPRTKIHYGFLVQGVDNEDLPEGLLCDMYVHGINMLEDPEYVRPADEEGEEQSP